MKSSWCFIVILIASVSVVCALENPLQLRQLSEPGWDGPTSSPGGGGSGSGSGGGSGGSGGGSGGSGGSEYEHWFDWWGTGGGAYFPEEGGGFGDDGN